MKKTAVKILSALLMLSMVFSSNVFAAEKTNSAWDSFLGLFSGNATTAADTQIDGVTYQTHIQNEGWAQGWVSDGTMSGSEGKGLRLEGLEVKIDHTKLPADLGITYQTQIQNDGWAQGWVSDGAMSGSEGKGLRLEAVQIKLTGESAGDYSVGYKTHIQNKGWETDWSYNGATSGTVGEGLRLEAIEIEIFKNIPDLTAYEAALAAVKQADYTTASWTAYQAVVNANVVTTDNLISEVDAATANITAAQANLVLVPKVTSVTAINATQLQVVFNSAVDPATLFADGTGTSGVLKTLGSGQVVTLTGLDSQAASSLTGVLSTDGKTLTLTNTSVLAKRYDVTIDGLKTTGAVAFTKYVNMITVAADTTAPTIVSTTVLSATTAKVTFSEPMNSLGNITYKLANGTTATTVTNDFAPGAKSEVVFTLGANIAVGDVVTATFVGASDMAGNLLTPNPTSVTFTKSGKDGVIPTIASITQTGAKTFAVKFSEQIIAAPTVGITNNSTISTIKDKADATVYNVTVTNALDGLTTINFGTFTDLSGEVASAQTKVATFTKDTVAPKVISSAVVSDINDGKQYLELTFDKDVALSTAMIASTTTGSYVKDFVTTPITSLTNSTLLFKNATDKKVVRTDLATLLTGKDVATASYTLALNLSGVTSVSGVAFVNPTSVTFTRGVDGSGTNTTVLGAPTIAPGADNNKVNVKFPAAVDGASATNTANYTIAGATIESVSLQPVAGDLTQTAVLNLVANSNTFSGVRNATVANVKASGSTVTMVAFATTVNIKENVLPTLSSAKVTAVSDATAGSSEILATTSVTATVTPVVHTGVGNITVTAGAFNGVANETLTVTKLAGGYSTDGTTTVTLSGTTFTYKGLTIETSGVTTPATSDTWTIALTAHVAAVAPTNGTTTVVATFSEPVNVPGGVSYTVNVGGTAVAGTTAAVTTTTSTTTVTIVIDKKLAATDFTSGVTLTSTDYKITDDAGNKAAIGTGGIVVTL